MNNTFSIKRFGLLLKRQWLEFGKIYLISLVVVLGVFIAFYGFYYYAITTQGNFSTSTMSFRIPLFVTMGILFITVVASSYFSHLGHKSRAVIDLMIPASTFEKFLGSIIFTTVLGIISYLLIFYLTDWIFIMKLRNWYQSTAVTEQVRDVDQFFPYFFIQHHEYLPIPVFLTPFFITSIFLLGSIYFEKFHYIKTAICIMIFSGIWAAIIAKSAKVLFEGRIPIYQTPYIRQTKDGMELWVALLIVALTLIFWALTYVRLKEKEV